jgi:hypothetical protein
MVMYPIFASISWIARSVLVGGLECSAGIKVIPHEPTYDERRFIGILLVDQVYRFADFF